MGWNIYPNYQGPAPASPTGWNHVRIEVVGAGMRVYVNREAKPSLVVPRLWGSRREGGVTFKGPAVFANLVVDPGAPAGATLIPTEPAAAGTVMQWRAAQPTLYDRGAAVSAKDMPAADAWRPIEAEPTGLVDLGRVFRAARMPSLAWLKTEVVAAAAARRTLQVGFAEELWVFLNGRLVYSGANPYYPEGARLSPDGRLQSDNASIPLDLREGRNEIVLAVGDDWRTSKGRLEPSPYGWAAEARFDRIEGLDLR